MLRVLKQDLGMFLYRIQIYHKLTAADMTRRLDMVNVLIRKVEDCQGFLSDLWTSDEAHCHFDGQVNSHNNIYWGTKAPIQRFWEELDATCSTRTRQYLQQDGATPHTSNITIKWLKDHFKSRIISKKCAIEWPLLSPDLSPPDYFLWGFSRIGSIPQSPGTLANSRKDHRGDRGHKKRCSP
ncbi:hypothetical protein LOD99_15096 [Oopsacas minuta]|uniref:Transposase n=1 Tax=Oopsacas minuta TaxID=111878 RepID=A0AAV7KCH9_9METZ|nr:hypothetical protein LOD99_15096 [Oopsacas minuta]